jgi:hypothetical protein
LGGVGMTDKERIEDIKKRWFEDGENLPVKDISWLIIKVEKEAGKKEKWLQRTGYMLKDDGSYVFRYSNNKRHSFTADTIENLDVERLEYYHIKYLETMEAEEKQKN